MKYLQEHISRNSKLLGFMLGYKDSEGTVRVGWSKYNENDEQDGIEFDEYTAKGIAYVRAQAQLEDDIPKSIRRSLNSFIVKCKKHYNVQEVLVCSQWKS
jgi:hypothetical protein